jgi:hypothetical protein
MTIMRTLGTLAEAEKLIDDYRERGIDIYIRWSRGKGYDNRPSRDYANGGQHTGLSASKIGNWGGEYLLRRLTEYRFLRIKDNKIRGYLVTGKQVGLDSDGYELIDVNSIDYIAKLGDWTL